MNVLISGAYGFVGSNLCRFLTQKGWHCTALDVMQGDAPYSSSYQWNSVEKIPWESFDAVVHLAGKAHDTKNRSQASAYFEINCGLTEKIFTACAGRTKRFLFFSSVKACADRVDGVLTEEMPCDPKTPYGQSKWQAEQWINQADAKGMERVILRPAMIHGPGNKGNLNLLWNVARRGIPWPLGAFENRRSMTSIQNVCAIVEAFASGKGASGVYQIADDEAVSVNQLVTWMADAAGKPRRIWRVPCGLMRGVARCGDWLHLPLNRERLQKLTESYVVSNEKCKKTLGWNQMPITAQAGMEMTLRSFEKRGTSCIDS